MVGGRRAFCPFCPQQIAREPSRKPNPQLMAWCTGLVGKVAKVGKVGKVCKVGAESTSPVTTLSIRLCCHLPIWADYSWLLSTRWPLIGQWSILISVKTCWLNAKALWVSEQRLFCFVSQEIFFLLWWHEFEIGVAAIVVTSDVKGVKNVAPIRSVHSRPILFGQLLSAYWQRLLFAYWKCSCYQMQLVQLAIEEIQIFFHGSEKLFPGGSFLLQPNCWGSKEWNVWSGIECASPFSRKMYNLFIFTKQCLLLFFQPWWQSTLGWDGLVVGGAGLDKCVGSAIIGSPFLS